MADPAFKKVQVVGTSPRSISEATANAVAKVAQSESAASWFEVAEIRGAVADGQVKQYQVTVSVGCRMD